MRRTVWESTVVLLLCACSALGQEPAVPKTEAVERPAAGAPDGRPARVRLPAYFAAVVTPAQREQIYKLQLRYFERAEELQRQMAALEVERDKELDGLLTPEQLAEVQKRRAAAAARRRPGESSASDEEPRADAPAAP
jgi:hypothetical protein